MAASDGPALALAKRLRELRTSQWPGIIVKQEQLKTALGVSVPLISSWESLKSPVPPPEGRLDSLALFFASERSLQANRPRLLKLSELTDDENANYVRLANELKRLRAIAVGGASPPSVISTPPNTAAVGAGFWRFQDGAPITIVCGLQPKPDPSEEAYTHPDSPDFVALYTFTDFDAMMEIHGHIRATNPDTLVTFAQARGERKVTQDQLMNHLVVLGGVDFNPINEEVVRRLRVPVKQQDRENDPVGAFEASASEGKLLLAPQLRETSRGRFLIEDVGHFVRGPNPFNQKRTVTICNGQYARGVYGAVRALTDSEFRDRNTDYLHERFKPTETFSLLFRVPVIRGDVITPDWTQAGTVLHEWSGSLDAAQPG